MNRHARRAERARARNDPRLTGMDVRYGGRTLYLTVFANTDEDGVRVADRVKRGAAGPERRMALVALRAVPSPDTFQDVWQGAGITTYFDGRTLVFDVYINTDESLEAVSDRLMASVRVPESPDTEKVLRVIAERDGAAPGGPVSIAVVVLGGDSDPALARDMWAKMFAAAERTVENEN